MFLIKRYINSSICLQTLNETNSSVKNDDCFSLLVKQDKKVEQKKQEAKELEAEVGF